MIGNPHKLTILTDPVPVGLHSITEPLKHAARSLRDKITPRPKFMRSHYRGHFAVTRSLVEGLRKIGYSFNYNPKRLREIADVVIVLSGVSALRQAIALKRRGLIRKLLAGPNLITFPSDQGGIICSAEVDVCVTPGPLTCDIYTEDCPALDGRCVGWPAGVDTAFWSPQPASRGKSILIYDKLSPVPADTIAIYVDWIRQKGYETRFIEYGNYTVGGYLSVLRRSSLMIGFSAAESQGVSWAEAWSADVPTLMWHKDRNAYNHPRSGARIFKSSTAPYLTDSTGAFFRTFDEFADLFSAWEAGETRFNPRQWALDNMSDEVCARRLLEIAGLEPKESSQ